MSLDPSAGKAERNNMINGTPQRKPNPFIFSELEKGALQNIGKVAPEHPNAFCFQHPRSSVISP